jgi:cyclic pyranopterin phosphate synthase
MRLTSDGKLKTCIYSEPVVDLLPYIKNRDVEGLFYAVRDALTWREPRFKFYPSSAWISSMNYSGRSISGAS